MKKTLLLLSLFSLFDGTEAFARVQETRIHFVGGATATATGDPVAGTTVGWWNEATITQGGPGVRPSGTTISGLPLMDATGNTARYTFSYTKTGSLGIWAYNNQTIPVNPDYTIPEAYRTKGGVGGNNSTISKYSISGFTVGDTLDLAFGGLVNDSSSYQNRYAITITGATVENLNIDTALYLSNTTAFSWSSTGNSITLMMGSGTASAQSGFAAMLSGMTMTSDTLSIQIDSRSGTAGGAGTGGGSTYGLSYFAVLPEPATTSLGIMGFAALALRRRR